MNTEPSFVPATPPLPLDEHLRDASSCLLLLEQEGAELRTAVAAGVAADILAAKCTSLRRRWAALLLASSSASIYQADGAQLTGAASTAYHAAVKAACAVLLEDSKGAADTADATPDDLVNVQQARAEAVQLLLELLCNDGAASSTAAPGSLSRLWQLWGADRLAVAGAGAVELAHDGSWRAAPSAQGAASKMCKATGLQATLRSLQVQAAAPYPLRPLLQSAALEALAASVQQGSLAEGLLSICAGVLSRPAAGQPSLVHSAGLAGTAYAVATDALQLLCALLPINPASPPASAVEDVKAATASATSLLQIAGLLVARPTLLLELAQPLPALKPASSHIPVASPNPGAAALDLLPATGITCFWRVCKQQLDEAALQHTRQCLGSALLSACCLPGAPLPSTPGKCQGPWADAVAPGAAVFIWHLLGILGDRDLASQVAGLEEGQEGSGSSAAALSAPPRGELAAEDIAAAAAVPSSAAAPASVGNTMVTAQAPCPASSKDACAGASSDGVPSGHMRLALMLYACTVPNSPGTAVPAPRPATTATTTASSFDLDAAGFPLEASLFGDLFLEEEAVEKACPALSPAWITCCRSSASQQLAHYWRSQLLAARSVMSLQLVFPPALLSLLLHALGSDPEEDQAAAMGLSTLQESMLQLAASSADTSTTLLTVALASLRMQAAAAAGGTRLAQLIAQLAGQHAEMLCSSASAALAPPAAPTPSSSSSDTTSTPTRLTWSQGIESCWRSLHSVVFPPSRSASTSGYSAASPFVPSALELAALLLLFAAAPPDSKAAVLRMWLATLQDLEECLAEQVAAAAIVAGDSTDAASLANRLTSLLQDVAAVHHLLHCLLTSSDDCQPWAQRQLQLSALRLLVEPQAGPHATAGIPAFAQAGAPSLLDIVLLPYDGGTDWAQASQAWQAASQRTSGAARMDGLQVVRTVCEKRALSAWRLSSEWQLQARDSRAAEGLAAAARLCTLTGAALLMALHRCGINAPRELNACDALAQLAPVSCTHDKAALLLAAGEHSSALGGLETSLPATLAAWCGELLQQVQLVHHAGTASDLQRRSVQVLAVRAEMVLALLQASGPSVEAGRIQVARLLLVFCTLYHQALSAALHQAITSVAAAMSAEEACAIVPACARLVGLPLTQSQLEGCIARLLPDAAPLIGTLLWMGDAPGQAASGLAENQQPLSSRQLLMVHMQPGVPSLPASTAVHSLQRTVCAALRCLSTWGAAAAPASEALEMEGAWPSSELCTALDALASGSAASAFAADLALPLLHSLQAIGSRVGDRTAPPAASVPISALLWAQEQVRMAADSSLGVQTTTNAGGLAASAAATVVQGSLLSLEHLGAAGACLPAPQLDQLISSLLHCLAGGVATEDVLTVLLNRCVAANGAPTPHEATLTFSCALRRQLLQSSPEALAGVLQHALLLTGSSRELSSSSGAFALLIRHLLRKQAPGRAQGTELEDDLALGATDQRLGVAAASDDSDEAVALALLVFQALLALSQAGLLDEEVLPSPAGCLLDVLLSSLLAGQALGVLALMQAIVTLGAAFTPAAAQAESVAPHGAASVEQAAGAAAEPAALCAQPGRLALFLPLSRCFAAVLQAARSGPVAAAAAAASAATEHASSSSFADHLLTGFNSSGHSSRSGDGVTSQGPAAAPGQGTLDQLMDEDDDDDNDEEGQYAQEYEEDEDGEDDNDEAEEEDEEAEEAEYMRRIDEAVARSVLEHHQEGDEQPEASLLAPTAAPQATLAGANTYGDLTDQEDNADEEGLRDSLLMDDAGLFAVSGAHADAHYQASGHALPGPGHAPAGGLAALLAAASSAGGGVISASALELAAVQQQQQQQQQQHARRRRHSLSSQGSGHHGRGRRQRPRPANGHASGSGAHAPAAGGPPPFGTARHMVNCSFSDSGETFIEQHWYFCYTCGLVESKGCCSCCVQVCHAGHDVVYSGRSRFFCDCGAGVPRCPPCKCLEPVPLPSGGMSAGAAGGTAGSPSHLHSAAVLASASWPHGDPLSAAWAYDPQQLDAAELLLLQATSAEGLAHVGQVVATACNSNTHDVSLAADALHHLLQQPGAAGSEALSLLRSACYSITACAAVLVAQLSTSHAQLAVPPTLAWPTAAVSVPAAPSVCISSIPPASCPATAAIDDGFDDGDESTEEASQDEEELEDAAAEPLLGEQALGMDPHSPQETDSAEDTTANVAVQAPANGVGSAGTAASAASPPETAIRLPTNGPPQLRELFRLQRIVRVGNLDGRLRAEPAPLAAPELREALDNGVVSRSHVACCGATSLLAVSRGSQIGFLDMQQHASEMVAPQLLAGLHSVTAPVVAESEAVAPAAARGRCAGTNTVAPAAATAATAGGTTTGGAVKGSYSLLTRHYAKFHVVNLAFDNRLGRHLAVAGLREVQVWTVEERGKVSDRLPLVLPSERNRSLAGHMTDLIVQVQWLPLHDTQLAVTTPLGMYIFDIALSASRPVWAVTAGTGELLAASCVFRTLQLSTAPAGAPVACASSSGTDCDSATRAGLPMYNVHVLLLTRDADVLHARLPTPTPCVTAGVTPTRLCRIGPAPPAASLSGHRVQFCEGSGHVLLSCSAAGQERLFRASFDAAEGRLVDMRPVVLAIACGGAGHEASASNGGAMLSQWHDCQLLPAARAELGFSSLLCSARWDRAAGSPVALAIGMSSTSDGCATGDAPVTLPSWAVSLHNSTDAGVEGIAHLLCPVTSQTIVVLLCCKGNLYFYFTPKPAAAPLFEPLATLLRAKCVASVREPAPSSTHVAEGPAAATASVDAVAAMAEAPCLNAFLPLLHQQQPRQPRSASPTHHQQAGAESRTHVTYRRRRQVRHANLGRLLLEELRRGGGSEAVHTTPAGIGATHTTSSGGTSSTPGASPSGAAASGLGSPPYSTENLQASTPVPADLLERAEVITQQVRLAGDISHVGGMESARRLLCDPAASETYLESPSKASFKLVLKPLDTNTAIIGVKLLVGVSGPQHVPAMLRLGATTVLAPPAGARRWVQVMLPPAEAATGPAEVALIVGATADGAAAPRLHRLEVYGQAREAAQARLTRQVGAASLPFNAAAAALVACSVPELLAQPSHAAQALEAAAECLLEAVAAAAAITPQAVSSDSRHTAQEDASDGIRAAVQGLALGVLAPAVGAGPPWCPTPYMELLAWRLLLGQPVVQGEAAGAGPAHRLPALSGLVEGRWSLEEGDLLLAAHPSSAFWPRDERRLQQAEQLLLAAADRACLSGRWLGGTAWRVLEAVALVLSVSSVRPQALVRFLRERPPHAAARLVWALASGSQRALFTLQEQGSGAVLPAGLTHPVGVCLAHTIAAWATSDSAGTGSDVGLGAEASGAFGAGCLIHELLSAAAMPLPPQLLPDLLAELLVGGDPGMRSDGLLALPTADVSGGPQGPHAGEAECTGAMSLLHSLTRAVLSDNSTPAEALLPSYRLLYLCAAGSSSGGTMHHLPAQRLVLKHLVHTLRLHLSATLAPKSATAALTVGLGSPLAASAAFSEARMQTMALQLSLLHYLLDLGCPHTEAAETAQASGGGVIAPSSAGEVQDQQLADLLSCLLTLVVQRVPALVAAERHQQARALCAAGSSLQLSHQAPQADEAAPSHWPGYQALAAPMALHHAEVMGWDVDDLLYPFASAAEYQHAHRLLSPAEPLLLQMALHCAAALMPASASPSRRRPLPWQQDGSLASSDLLPTVLCDAVRCDALHPARRAIRQLLTEVCCSAAAAKEKQHAAAVARGGSDLMAVICRLAASPDNWHFKCDLTRSLTALGVTVGSGSTAWTAYCHAVPELLPSLVRCVIGRGGQHAARPAVELLTYALAGSGKRPSSSETGAAQQATSTSLIAVAQTTQQQQLPSSWNAMKPVLDLGWLGLSPASLPGSWVTAGQQLQETLAGQLVAGMLLRAGDETLRKLVYTCMKLLWKLCNSTARRQLLALLLSLVPVVLTAGEDARQFFELLRSLLGTKAAPGPALPATGAGSTGASAAAAAGSTNVSGAATAGTAALPRKRDGKGSNTAAASSGAAPSSAAYTSATPPSQAAPSARQLLTDSDVSRAVASAFGALRQANAVLRDHPLADVYMRLWQLLDVGDTGGGGGASVTSGTGLSLAASSAAASSHPHYLEVDVAAVAAAAGRSQIFVPLKLDSVKAEIRYGDHQVFARLNGCYSVQSVTLAVADSKRQRSVRSLRLSVACVAAADLQELRNHPNAWTTLAWADMAPGQTELVVPLEVPISATCLRLDLTAFHVNLQEASQEVLQCPRCSGTVTDRFGICGYCGENAHQCRHCRAINYEQLDGFLCSECGYSRFGRLDLTLQAAPSWEHPAITNETQRAAAQVTLEALADDLARKQAGLISVSRQLSQALGSAGFTNPTARVLEASTARDRPAPGSAVPVVNGGVTAGAAANAAAMSAVQGLSSSLAPVPQLYCDKAAGLHREAVHVAQRLAGLKAALLAYLEEDSDAPASAAPAAAGAAPLVLAGTPLLVHRPPGITYRSALAAVPQLLKLLLALMRYSPTATKQLARCGLAAEVTAVDLPHPSKDVSAPARYLLLKLAMDGGREAGGGASLVRHMQARLVHLVSGGALLPSDILTEVLAVSKLLADIAATELLAAPAAMPAPPVGQPAGLPQPQPHLQPLGVAVASATVAAADAAAAAVPCVQACILVLHQASLRAGTQPSVSEFVILPMLQVLADALRTHRSLLLQLMAAMPLPTPPTAAPTAAMSAVAGTPDCERRGSSSVKPAALIHAAPVDDCDVTRRRSSSSELTAKMATAFKSSGSLGSSSSLRGGTPAGGLPLKHAAGQIPPPDAEPSHSGGAGMPAAAASILPSLTSASALAAAATTAVDASCQAQALAGAAKLQQLLHLLLLNPTSRAVRTQAVALLRALHKDSKPGCVLQELVGLVDTACRAGDAAEEVFVLLQDAVVQAAAAACYSGLGALLAAVMQQLPTHVYHLLCEEGPGTGGLAAIATSGYTPGSAGSPSPSSSTPASSALRSEDAVNTSLAGLSSAYTLKHLVGLLSRLVDHSQLYAQLLARGYLPAVVWSHAGLQALQIGRSRAAGGAEAALGALLTSRFMRGGDEMKRILAKAALSALVLLHQRQPPGGTAGALLMVPPSVQRRMHTALLQSVLAAVSPSAERARSYLLLLEKSLSQEEFIPGTMGPVPFKSGDIGGPLMRHVKDLICRRLDMIGVIDDDFGMELLVAGNIIDLSLPIEPVYEQVWRPYLAAGGGNIRPALLSRLTAAASGSGDPPMVVTYRLSGLDGDATEPVVKALSATAQAAADPECEYSAATALLECGPGGGLALLLQLLNSGHATTTSSQNRGAMAGPAAAAAGGSAGSRRLAGRLLLLQLLRTACHLRACRAALLELGGLAALVAELHASMAALVESHAPHRGAGTAVRPAALPSRLEAMGSELLLLLQVLEQLAGEAAARPPHRQQWHQLGPQALTDAEAKGAQQVKQLADGLDSLSAMGFKDCAALLASVLPLLAHGNTAAQVGLLDHFAPSLDMAALDALQQQPERQNAVVAQLDSFTSLLQALTGSTTPLTSAADGSAGSAGRSPSGMAAVTAGPHGGTGAAFRDLVLQRGVAAQLVNYLLEVFVEMGPSQPPQTPDEAPSPSDAARSPNTPGMSAKPSAAACATWQAALQRRGVALCLKLLAALAAGHAATCAAIAAPPGALALLHKLEGVAGGATVAPLAEALLAALAAPSSNSPEAAAQVEELREATKRHAKEMAARRRQQMLSSMRGLVSEGGGFASSPPSSPQSSPLPMQPRSTGSAMSSGRGPGRTSWGGGVSPFPMPSPASPLVTPPGSQLAAELAALEAEEEAAAAVAGDTLCCMVCREGYSLRPDQLLGVYCFCKVVPATEAAEHLPPAISGSRNAMPYLFTTVSHFNLIHVACHMAAKLADANLRQPKREWEGATLRNGEVRCNCLVPLRGARVSDAAYAAALSTYWEQLADLAPAPSSVASGSGAARAALLRMDSVPGRLSLVVSDLSCLLNRFAAQRSFSVDCGGGGRESNALLVPQLLQLGTYLAMHCSSSDRAELGAPLSILDAAVGSSSGNVGSGSGSGSTASWPYVLCLTLLAQSWEQWGASRLSAAALAVRSTTEVARASSGSPTAAGITALRFFALVDGLQHHYKRPAGAGQTGTAGETGSGRGGAPVGHRTGAWPWLGALHVRLGDARAMQPAAEELLAGLSALEDVEDVAGVLQVLHLPTAVLHASEM